MNKRWDFKVDLKKLRADDINQRRFWNLIYYFNEYHLPYEFILPYEDKEFEKKMKRYEAKIKKQVNIRSRH